MEEANNDDGIGGSSGSRNAGEKMIICVVECVEAWGDGITRRIRIRPHDHPSYQTTNASSSSLEQNTNTPLVVTTQPHHCWTGVQLYHVLLHKMMAMLLEDTTTLTTATTLTIEIMTQIMTNNNVRRPVVEVYVERSSQFVSLLDPTLFHNTRIVPHVLGTRLRCIISHLHDHIPNHANTNSQSEQSTPPAALMGRYYPYDPHQGMDITMFDNHNTNDENKGNKTVHTVVVKEMANNLEEDGTGLNVWDGAILLAKYLEARPNKVKGQRVLELGAGCGLVGIVAATLGAREVMLTDLPYALPLLTENVMANQHHYVHPANSRIDDEDNHCRVTCTTCDWFHPSAVTFATTVDVILVADCVWLEELVDPLLHTLDQLTQEASSSSTTSTRILITYQRRGKSTHERFLKGLHSIFHHIHDIDTHQFGIHKPNVFS
eukprot:CAMPEP_0198286020 /NCGR_PEP_ID=MMETSP1449-20131203/5201_1 /TAXON_ID=420275 /ORGANISM="Attheya septentrionalis, Strain CCMP2084" /LENGTH=432 /DNA_ID=CAMNT_0043983639 /DNA_START=143 /DNA_END=1438 /DNA_ORIENTATION=+